MDREEQKHKELKRLGQELHIPIAEAFLEFEVRDKDGKVIQKYRQRSHSWVRNAYNYLFSSMCGKNCPDAAFEAGKLSMKATSGTIRYGNRGAGIVAQMDFEASGSNASAGVDTYGILVGSGEAAESFEDYFLQTQIANGTGAGQLSHVAAEPQSASYDAPTRVFRDEFKRYFNNNSGGDITVNEVAMVFHMERVVGTADNLLLSRDKLATGITVPNTGQLKVTYTVQLTYPA